MKKQPERICAVCRTVLPKRELLRLVRDKEGIVSIDETGKSPGRGAYICANPECLKKAKKQRSLERSLKAKLPEEMYDAIQERLMADANPD